MTNCSTLAEGEREPVVERRVEQPGLAGDARHERASPPVGHVVHDAEADGVVRLPEVVPGEAGQRRTPAR